MLSGICIRILRHAFYPNMTRNSTAADQMVGGCFHLFDNWNLSNAFYWMQFNIASCADRF